MNAVWRGPDRFRPAPTVRRIHLGGRGLLFCERRQQLFELNPTADLIWSALLEEAPPRAARRLLGELGDDPGQAEGHVWTQLSQWLGEGLWEPADAERRGPAGEAALRMAVDGARVEMLCGDAGMLGRLGAVFGQFPGFRGAPGVRLRITPWAAGFHLFDNDRYVGAFAAEAVVPQVKALLTERVTRRRFDGFFAHGALLAKGPVLAMLSGPPGAGKSTLALALQAAGWSAWTDDLIRVDAAARFRGVPFAPAIKEGAWPLLQALRPELAQWPIELRSDGQKVRYAPIAWPAQRPGAPNLFIALARKSGAPAHAEPIDPVDALSALLGESFSARGRISADLMARLAARFRKVTCRRLVYDALDAAVDAVEALGREL
jgi:hypothetical protein